MIHRYTPPMTKKPEQIDRETWQRERAVVWAKRNRVLNFMMVVVVAAIVLRSCS